MPLFWDILLNEAFLLSSAVLLFFHLLLFGLNRRRNWGIGGPELLRVPMVILFLGFVLAFMEGYLRYHDVEEEIGRQADILSKTMTAERVSLPR
jgi:hypothetical protein